VLSHFEFSPLVTDVYAFVAVLCKHSITHKTGNTQHIATPPQQDRATAMDNMQEQLVKIGV